MVFALDMAMTYSLDLKERVVDYCKNGGSRDKASQIFQVGLRTVFRWVSYEHHLGNLNPPLRKIHKARKLDRNALFVYIKRNPDRTLTEIADYFGVYPHAIWYACKQGKITRKKSHCLS